MLSDMCTLTLSFEPYNLLLVVNVILEFLFMYDNSTITWCLHSHISFHIMILLVHVIYMSMCMTNVYDVWL